MHTVSNALLRSSLAGVEAAGHNVEEFLSKAGIAYSTYQDTHARIDGKQFAQLMYTIGDKTNDARICFSKKPINNELFNKVFSKVISQCSTLREFIAEWDNFFSVLQVDETALSSIKGRNFIWATDIGDVRDPSKKHFLLMTVLLTKARFLSWLIGSEIPFEHFSFTTSAPDYVDEYPALLPCSFSFNQPYNSIAFNKGFLGFPIIRTREECLDYRNQLSADWFEIYDGGPSIARQVESAISVMKNEDNSFPTIKVVARKLLLSERSLRRKLQLENENFRSIKNRVWCNLAIDKLSHSDRPISVIADELGFSEPTAFCRAFKSLMKVPPQQFRESSKN